MMTPLGTRFVVADSGDGKALAAGIARTPGLKLVFLESPANPTLRMTDIAAVVQAARAHPDAPLVVVDNTFLGPAFQHPLALGVDLVVYSATKYLNGFSDLLGGVVLARNAELITHLRSTRALLGNILQPDECWLLNTRLPTVGLRMNKQSKNAQRIAEALEGHPALERVIYPSLFKDPEQVRIRDAQCDYPGGIITLEIKGGRPAAFSFLRRLRIAHNAVSLGGVESLACHPRTTTHSEMSPEQLDHAGISEGMVRLSVGIENWHDLLEDFRAGLEGL
jgi:cystathionine beta-lyase/cystathionine gamma-synthase